MVSSVKDISEDSIIYDPCVFFPWGHTLLPWDGGMYINFQIARTFEYFFNSYSFCSVYQHRAMYETSQPSMIIYAL